MRKGRKILETLMGRFERNDVEELLPPVKHLCHHGQDEPPDPSPRLHPEPWNHLSRLPSSDSRVQLIR